MGVIKSDINLTLCLTHNCNLACSYCYAGAKSESKMSDETAKRAVDFAASMNSGSMQIGFFGGEPLMEFDLLKRTVEYINETLSERRLVFTLTTNATLLTAEKIEWLRDNKFFLGISMDGNRQMHNATRPFANGGDSFDTVEKGLDLMIDSEVPFEVITVVDPSNAAYVGDGIRYLAERGVKRIALNPNFYTEWNEDEVGMLDRGYEDAATVLVDSYRNGAPFALNVLDAKIVTALKKGYACRDKCSFGIDEIAVAASGRIYPCERLVGDDSDDNICIGNVHEGFDDEQRTSVIKQRGNKDPECESCPLQSRCMNWCGCINYTTTGRIDSTSGFVCHHEKLAVRVADKAAAELFAEGNKYFLARFYHENGEG